MDKINTTGEKSMHTMSTLSAEPFERDWVVDEVLNNWSLSQWVIQMGGMFENEKPL
jgi:hypothetical protein